MALSGYDEAAFSEDAQSANTDKEGFSEVENHIDGDRESDQQWGSALSSHEALQIIRRRFFSEHETKAGRKTLRKNPRGGCRLSLLSEEDTALKD